MNSDSKKHDPLRLRKEKQLEKPMIQVVQGGAFGRTWYKPHPSCKLGNAILSIIPNRETFDAAMLEQLYDGGFYVEIVPDIIEPTAFTPRSK